MLRRLISHLASNKGRQLVRAAEMGRLEQVKALLEVGTNPNAESDGGFTALMWAAARGHIDVVDALLESGADLETRTRKGRTAVDIAIQEGHDNAVRLLQEKAAAKRSHRE